MANGQACPFHVAHLYRLGPIAIIIIIEIINALHLRGKPFLESPSDKHGDQSCMVNPEYKLIPLIAPPNTANSCSPWVNTEWLKDVRSMPSINWKLRRFSPQKALADKVQEMPLILRVIQASLDNRTSYHARTPKVPWLECSLPGSASDLVLPSTNLPVKYLAELVK